MVNWKSGLLLLAVLAVLAFIAFQTRPRPAPPESVLFPCDVVNALDLLVTGRDGKQVEVARPTDRDAWVVVKPVSAPADQDSARALVEDLHSIVPGNAIQHPDAPSVYGLDSPRVTVRCRVTSGASYTLTVGKENFDSSGYYAAKAGDGRVYVISSVPIDDFDRQLITPPVRSGASPSPSPN
jgi:hypothetical protein